MSYPILTPSPWHQVSQWSEDLLDDERVELHEDGGMLCDGLHDTEHRVDELLCTIGTWGIQQKFTWRSQDRQDVMHPAKK